MVNYQPYRLNIFFVSLNLRLDEGLIGTLNYFFELLVTIGMTIWFFWTASEVNEVGEKIKTALLHIPEVCS